MRIVVTGAFGRLGSAVTALALARGDQVVALDRTIPDAVPAAAEPIRLDLSDYAGLRAVVEGADALVHLAAYLSPQSASWDRVYGENSLGSYHALLAAAEAGVQRVCLASSINAVGGIYSRAPQFDYFPLDVDHPSYAEDPYGLSKWVMEQQARSIVRSFPALSVASLRLHGLTDLDDRLAIRRHTAPEVAARELWGYSPLHASAEACLAALTADIHGAEVFYCVAEQTTSAEPTEQLLRRYYPAVPLRRPLPDHRAPFDSTPARERLGWPA